jgi:hypothetical protein
MKLQEAIEATKNYKGMKCSVSGMIANGKRGFLAFEFDKNYHAAREAWLKSDLKTVSDFFGIYV